MKKELTRCTWAKQYEIFLPYHDEQWGVPCYEAQSLFRMLCLELMQAGLSWRLILEKEQHFNHYFKDFTPEKLAKFSQTKIDSLLQQPKIIRNKAKINAVINNAKCYLALEKDNIDFSELIWSVVNGKPIVNAWKSHKDLPTKTSEAEQLTKLLKNHGFKFLGPTIAYSFMQAVGMVNDHLVDCFRYTEV